MTLPLSPKREDLAMGPGGHHHPSSLSPTLSMRAPSIGDVPFRMRPLTGIRLPASSQHGALTVYDCEQSGGPPSTLVRAHVRFVPDAYPSSAGGSPPMAMNMNGNDHPPPPFLFIMLGTNVLHTLVEQANPLSVPHYPGQLEGEGGYEAGVQYLQLSAEVPSAAELERAIGPHCTLSVHAMIDGAVVEGVDFDWYNSRIENGPRSASSASSPHDLPMSPGTHIKHEEIKLESSSSFSDPDAPWGTTTSRGLLGKRSMSELEDSPTPGGGIDPSSTTSSSSASEIVFPTPVRRRPNVNIKPRIVRAAAPPAPMPDEFVEAEQTTKRPMLKRGGSLFRTNLIHSKTRLLPEQTRVNLRLNQSLDDMPNDWNDEERRSRRRLIQFWRRQRGQDIQFTFKPIRHDEYVSGTTVVSCILHKERAECYITSVDLIALLESLIGNKFSTEEKNRIRRNLEGFKPDTMSKSNTGPGNAAFFALIMGYDDPRPRNIEKDVKVFKWRSVFLALTKILSKYSYVASADLVHNEVVEDVDDSSDDEEQPQSVPKPKAKPAPARALRSRASARSIKREPKTTPSSPVKEATSTSVVRPMLSAASSSFAGLAHRETSSSAHSVSPELRVSIAATTMVSPSQIYQPQSPVTSSAPSSAQESSSPQSYIGMHRAAVNRNHPLYEAAGFLQDSVDRVTSSPESHPRYAHSAAEFSDESFEQRNEAQAMMRGGMEVDSEGRRIAHETLATPAFLSRLPQTAPAPAPQSTEPSFAHEHEQEYAYAQESAVHPPPATFEELAHRHEAQFGAPPLDESYSHSVSSMPSSLRTEASFMHELTYPIADQTSHTMASFSPTQQLYHSPSVMTHAMPQVSSDTSSYGHGDEQDPNDFILGPQVQEHVLSKSHSEPAFDHPQYSYAAITAASAYPEHPPQPAHSHSWDEMSHPGYHYSYDSVQMH